MKSKFVVNFSLIFIFLLTNSLNAQEITSGLEALTVTELPNGGKTYSLSLKILALMTALTILPSLVLDLQVVLDLVSLFMKLGTGFGTLMAH